MLFCWIWVRPFTETIKKTKLFKQSCHIIMVIVECFLNSCLFDFCLYSAYSFMWTCLARFSVIEYKKSACILILFILCIDIWYIDICLLPVLNKQNLLLTVNIQVFFTSKTDVISINNDILTANLLFLNCSLS